jgi:hypothetical protein
VHRAAGHAAEGVLEHEIGRAHEHQTRCNFRKSLGICSRWCPPQASSSHVCVMRRVHMAHFGETLSDVVEHLWVMLSVVRWPPGVTSGLECGKVAKPCWLPLMTPSDPPSGGRNCISMGITDQCVWCEGHGDACIWPPPCQKFPALGWGGHAGNTSRSPRVARHSWPFLMAAQQACTGMPAWLHAC